MSTTAGLAAYGFTPAMHAVLEARGMISEIPARVTAVHKERYALICDRALKKWMQTDGQPAAQTTDLNCSL